MTMRLTPPTSTSPPTSKQEASPAPSLSTVVNDPWIVNLDVDGDGRIIGLEVLDATRRLPASLLANRA